MSGKQRRPGFTIVELLTVTAMLSVLMAIFMVIMGPAKKAVHVTSCMSNLRQIGLAYKMYLADYGEYPDPVQLVHSTYVRSSQILACPEDTTFVPSGTASSYRFRAQIPPQFLLISTFHELDPNIVLAGCQHHEGQREIALKGDNSRTTPAVYPYYLALRAGGSVGRIPLKQIKRFFQMADQPILRSVYPGEPGYEDASK